MTDPNEPVRFGDYLLALNMYAFYWYGVPYGKREDCQFSIEEAVDRGLEEARDSFSKGVDWKRHVKHLAAKAGFVDNAVQNKVILNILKFAREDSDWQPQYGGYATGALPRDADENKQIYGVDLLDGETQAVFRTCWDSEIEGVIGRADRIARALIDGREDPAEP